MAAMLGSLTYDVLLRPQGSDADPVVVGQITVDLDGKLPSLPEPVAPLPNPPAELPEFIDLPADIKEEDR